MFWMLLAGLVLFMVGKSILPELLEAGKEGVAIVRVEGPILDSYKTVEELKAFADDPLVKAIVIRIDSPVEEWQPRKKFIMLLSESEQNTIKR